MTCDELLLHVLRHGGLPPGGEAHVAGCPRCAADLPALAPLGPALAPGSVPDPPPGLDARVLAAAAPLLAARVPPPAWGQVARALAVALPALPAVLALNAWLVLTAHAVLATVLPEPLTLWLVSQYAVLAALLVTLGYAAVPLVAAHQHRLEERHV